MDLDCWLKECVIFEEQWREIRHPICRWLFILSFFVIMVSFLLSYCHISLCRAQIKVIFRIRPRLRSFFHLVYDTLQVGLIPFEVMKQRDTSPANSMESWMTNKLDPRVHLRVWLTKITDEFDSREWPKSLTHENDQQLWHKRITHQFDPRVWSTKITQEFYRRVIPHKNRPRNQPNRMTHENDLQNSLLILNYAFRTVVWRFSVIKLFWKFSKNSPKKTAMESYFKKIIKTRLYRKYFPINFAKLF